jgi:hypothetical protein
LPCPRQFFGWDWKKLISPKTGDAVGNQMDYLLLDDSLKTEVY